MMSTFQRFSLGFLLLLVPLLDLVAQPVLPAIAPREVEIEGELEVIFPTLQRQPLLGFNPPPAVFMIPFGRRPTIGDYKQDTIDLPNTPLLRPVPPPVSALTAGLERGDEKSIRAEIGAGRHLTRVGRLWLDRPMGNRGAWFVHVDYEGSQGHQPFTNRTEKAPYNNFLGKFGVRNNTDALTWGAELQGTYDQYNVYAAQTSSGFFHDMPDRNGWHANARAWIERTGSAFDFKARVGYTQTDYTTKALANDQLDAAAFERTESRLDAALDLGYALSVAYLKAGGNVSMAGFDDQLFTERDDLGYNVGGGVMIRYRQLFQAEVGVRVLGFQTTANNGADQSQNYIAPEVRFSYFITPHLTAFAETVPQTESNSLHGLYLKNPYIVDEPVLRPTIRRIDAKIGAKWQRSGVHLSVYGNWQDAPQFQYFESATGAPYSNYSQGFFEARYAPVRILAAHADVSFFLGVVQASFSIAARQGEFKANGRDIPYFAPLVAQVLISAPFAQRKGLLQVSGGFENARRFSSTRVGTLPAFADVKVRLSYDFVDSFGLFGEVHHMGETRFTRWFGYPSATFVALGGLRLLL